MSREREEEYDASVSPAHGARYLDTTNDRIMEYHSRLERWMPIMERREDGNWYALETRE